MGQSPRALRACGQRVIVTLTNSASELRGKRRNRATPKATGSSCGRMTHISVDWRRLTRSALFLYAKSPAAAHGALTLAGTCKEILYVRRRGWSGAPSCPLRIAWVFFQRWGQHPRMHALNQQGGMASRASHRVCAFDPHLVGDGDDEPPQHEHQDCRVQSRLMQRGAGDR